MIIHWLPDERYYKDSKEGYRISFNHYGEEMTYTAWSPIPRKIIAKCNTKDAAMAECELHAMEKQR